MRSNEIDHQMLQDFYKLDSKMLYKDVMCNIIIETGKYYENVMYCTIFAQVKQTRKRDLLSKLPYCTKAGFLWQMHQQLALKSILHLLELMLSLLT